ncbi:aldehyde dehydrogenase (NADP(+)) [Sphingomonas sp. G-3-2-10]|uniref:aldehyde dehydrogenase (NADP(+)) n=1 Tax=Sphingomonas sp. G-3-2-10 TaxID=2728838 RepID=UPI00146E2CED|nr:aldehyde dehydrogenase (NADP(+)) [Sphingomonas sp. G-3-2-10]NML07152.1 aldehyde dehydrogenase (NADP(+)) [Sphingomonas sp. G-3-2-10]
MSLTGELFIASQRVKGAGDGFRAVSPATGAEIEPSFSVATVADVESAAAAAEAAFPVYSALPRGKRAEFLDAIADEIDALGETLTERAMAETGLPHARLTGERGRTSGQMRMFARELRLGEYLRARIDHEIPDRQPARKPDLRLRMVPLGPVTVFGASNFPLAFSTAGGDTASALAAGCPVIVKGHSAHPGTAELVAGAITRAAEKTGMPKGVFSLINGPGNSVGSALVTDPRIKAVGFTGSFGGGTQLMKLAANRPVPIPVYAEMSSINPVLLLPAALEARAEALAAGFVGSLTMGAGQFCTNPGLLLAIEGPALDRFLTAASDGVGGAAAQTMLTPGIHKAYESGVARMASAPAFKQLAEGNEAGGLHCGRAALFTISAKDFIADPEHAEEVFGATAMVVRCTDIDEVLAVLAYLEGQLTATLHFDEADTDLARKLVPVLERKVGRILANGWPTGVEVTDAIVHGGPFPSTSDGRSTSVGTLAIDRFLRPVSYQDLPDALLPEELRENYTGVPRRVDGKPTL